MAEGAMTENGHGNPLRHGFVKKGYVWSYILVTSLFFLWGFAYGLLDVLNKHFQVVLNITKLQTTGLQVAYFGGGYFAYSPVAGEILRRKGYRDTIISGLLYYSLGAILFWPVAKFSVGTPNPTGIFGGFVVCTFVIACGLATLEVCANSYVSVIPPIRVANFRLQFSQSFNGWHHLLWVYLAVAIMGLAVAACFFFTKLPEVTEAQLQAEAEALAATSGSTVESDKPFYKQVRPITGFIAQFLYVGAQVTIGSFFIFYTNSVGIEDTEGSQLLSYGLITFTVARFLGTALLSFISAPVMLILYGSAATIVSILIGSLGGYRGVACLIVVMFFESIMYPVIFVLGTTGLGRHTSRASALVVMGVSGGAVFPPIQAAIADAYNVRVSYHLVTPCFIYITGWAIYIWNINGRQLLVPRRRAEMEREIETAQGGMIPAGHVALQETSDPKQDFEHVER